MFQRDLKISYLLDSDVFISYLKKDELTPYADKVVGKILEKDLRSLKS